MAIPRRTLTVQRREGCYDVVGFLVNLVHRYPRGHNVRPSTALQRSRSCPMLEGEPQCMNGNRCKASQTCVRTTTTRQAAPKSWSKEPTVFPCTNELSDHAHRRHTGTNAISAFSNVTFILYIILCRDDRVLDNGMLSIAWLPWVSGHRAVLSICRSSV